MRCESFNSRCNRVRANTQDQVDHASLEEASQDRVRHADHRLLPQSEDNMLALENLSSLEERGEKKEEGNKFDNAKHCWTGLRKSAEL